MKLIQKGWSFPLRAVECLVIRIVGYADIGYLCVHIQRILEITVYMYIESDSGVIAST